MACFPANNMNTQTTLLQASRWKPWEPVLWLLAFAAPLVLPSHALIINEIAIVALFAVSLDLVLGYIGIVSLGHAAFFGMGAYTAALFAKHIHPDPLAGMAVAVGTATVLGALCSFTVMRGTDLTRLMVTLGVGLILMELANKLDWLTGGADGLQGVVMGPVLGQFEFDLYAARLRSIHSPCCCCVFCWRGGSCTHRWAARSRPSATTACGLRPSAFP